MNSKACNLKGVQQVFFLNQSKAASCCRADPVSINNTTLAELTNTWQHESQQLAQGHQLSSCRVCWTKENQGTTSYRQLNARAQIKQIEINLSNLCNHMCAYCSPKFSSEWQQSIQHNGEFVGISKTAKNNLKIVKQTADHENWLSQIETYVADHPPDSVQLNLIGGEPLMQHHSLTNAVTMMKPAVKKLVITTNLNPPTSKFLDQLLDTWPVEKLTFNISIDTVPEFNHVPRSGFDQQRFENNLNKLISRGITHKFLSVVSILNVFDLTSFLSWSPAQVVMHQLNNPSCLDINIVPDEHRKMLLDSLPGTEPAWVREVLSQPVEAIDLKLQEQYNYLTQYFSRTNTTVPNNMKFAQHWNWLQQRFNK